jgi:hypothetical protein
MEGFGRALMWIGGLIFAAGLLLVLVGRIPGLNRIPGDIIIRRENLTIFIPLGTMILLSVLLTIALNVIARLRR